MPARDPEPAFTTRPTIMARRGVVTSGHYLASQVGLEVLARGGNAIDAGVATAFALTLVKPHECGIGGECPIIIKRAGRADPFVISGQGRAPRSLTIERVRELGLRDIPGTGLIAAATPATVGALITALIEAGTLRLAETLGPVVDLARDGYAVYPAMRTSIASVQARIARWPSTAEIYLDGGVPEVGRIIRNTAWADAMTQLLMPRRGAGVTAARLGSKPRATRSTAARSPTGSKRSSDQRARKVGRPMASHRPR